MIESEWRSPARAEVSLWSVPSSRIVVGFDIRSPPCLASAAFAAWSSRRLAASTPLRNER